MWLNQPPELLLLFYYYYFLRFSLFVRDTGGEREAEHRQREKQVPCREPDVGLDRGTPGSGPEPKAELNC